MCRFVSRHELFPIRAPLMALEHCIAPFLDRCDEDDDHRITLAEWGKCLQLDEVSSITAQTLISQNLVSYSFVRTSQ